MNMANNKIYTFFYLISIAVCNVYGYCNSLFYAEQCAYDIVCKNEYFYVRDSIEQFRYDTEQAFLNCEPFKMNSGNSYIDQWDYYPIHLIYKTDSSIVLERYQQYELDDYETSIPRLDRNEGDMRIFLNLITLLDLNDNNYVNVPTVKELESLTVLKLSKNALTIAQLSNEFNLKSLVEIDLSHNTINDIQYDESSNVYRLLKKIDLSFNYLTKITEAVFDPFNELEFLDVSHNYIDTLSPITFEGMKQLLYLNISHNRISDINSSLFRFNDLKLLDLSNNKLTSIKTTDFNKLNKLKTLNLNDNFLKIIEKDTFRDMTLLSNLLLKNNKLENIDKETFSNNSILFNLDLSENNIRFISKGLLKGKNIHQFSIVGNKLEGSLQQGSFEGLNFVQILDLGHQNLQSIEDYAFNGLNNLMMLLINGNNIRTLSNKSFRGNLKELKRLDLSFNEIEKIEFEKDDLYNLLSLLLRNNHLTVINHDSFEGLNSLQYLDLSDNKITQVESNSFKSLKELINFEISNNPLNGTLEKSTFDGLHSLPSLDISCTLLSIVQNGSFIGMTQLTNLNISHSKIKTLEYNAFTNTGAIEIIDLSCNQLKNFNINSTELAHLDILYLNNNMIKTLDSTTLQSVSILTKVILAHNLIQSIDSNTFAYQNDLRSLDVSYNSYLKINLSFLNEAKHIDVLNLSGVKTDLSFANIKEVSLSQLIISNSSIADVKSLQMNELRSLITLNLSNNNISKLEVGTFNNMTSLRNVDLSHNRITYIQTSVFKDNSMILTLNISHNVLTTIAYGIFRGLIHLETLDISFNEIGDLQNERFYEVQSLRVLIADHNKIKSIDAEEFLGTSLTQLSIGENPIPCDVLVNLNRKGLPYQITATKLLDNSGENIDGIICNKETFGFDISTNIGTSNMSEISKTLLNIRDILLNHFKNQELNPTTTKIIADEKYLTNFNDQLQKSASDMNKILSNYSNSATQIAEKNNETNILLNKILNVLMMTPVTKAPPVKLTNDNATYENLLSYINKIKQDIDENLQLEKTSILNEVQSKISSVDSRLNSLLLPTDTPRQEKLSASGETKSIFTETCVALILVILSGFVLFKIYKSRVFIRQRFSVSTRELPGSMDSAL